MDSSRALPGASIDGSYHCGTWHVQEVDGIGLLQEWGLLDVFGMEVLENRAG